MNSSLQSISSIEHFLGIDMSEKNLSLALALEKEDFIQLDMFPI